MNMATPTIKKESFFEYNPVQKKILSCEFASGFELLCFSMAGQRPADRPAIARLSRIPNQNVNFFESVSKN